MKASKYEGCSWGDFLHLDLLDVKKRVFDPCQFECSIPSPEEQNAEYGAYRFHMSGRMIRFRVAKTTPTKIGQFVTLWERIGNAPIQPYDVSEPIDYYVISTRNGHQFGQFIFPKEVLYKHDILASNGTGGKRAIRVYPRWDKPTSRQAQKTQLWQLQYFVDIPLDDTALDLERIRMLYNPLSLNPFHAQ